MNHPLPAGGSDTVGTRGEIRTLRKLILSQPPLPIGLHAREEFRIADFELRIDRIMISNSQSQIRNSQLILVPAEGFEPTLSSF
jgi:hypothetical protein